MALRRRKRRATDFIVRPRPNRVNKKLIAITDALVTSSTTDHTDLLTATFPCTVTGLRWSLSVFGLDPEDVTFIYWAVVVQRAGTTLDGLSFSNGGTFYPQEEEVMSFGVLGAGIKAAGTTQASNTEGATRTMRKLQEGDKLVLVYYCSNDDGGSLSGVIQYFCKI